MSAGFTPGPWHADADTRPGWEWNWHIMAGPASPNRICFMANTSPDMEKAEANARLIAAAPDGFGIIEQLEESFTADGVYQQFLPAMRAYLAKARGQSGDS